MTSRVSPEPEQLQLQQLPGISCQFDIFTFLPTEADWLAFLKCLAEDNVEDLKVFSKHVAWTSFLQSCDTHGVWLHCPTGFTRQAGSLEAEHPYPSNPFFTAMFYNAHKCLLFMSESGVDFSRLTERGSSAYHMLMSAIHFMTARRCQSASVPDYYGLVTLFHRTLFTREQQTYMMQSSLHRGMSPLSWGVYLGLAQHVEHILYYHSPNCTLHSQSVGISEHITLDAPECTGSNPLFFTSPLCILLDLYGESKLAELKKLGIFRTGLIWKHWVDVMFDRNKVMIFAYMIFSMLLTLFTIVFSGSSVNDYLKNRCTKQPFEYPTRAIGVIVAWLVASLIVECITLLAVARKEYYRNKAGYPKYPRQNYRDMVGWLLPNAVALPVSAILLWLYVDTDRACALFDSYIYTISGLCNIILLLSSVCLIVCYLRLVSPLTTLMSSFYNSIFAFSVFVVFYLVLMGIFARMFQSIFIFSSSGDPSGSRADTVVEFLSAFYRTFLTSLNIVDSTIFIPKEDRIDLNVTHIFYILFVPVLFINFMVGILSSVVSQVLEHDIENRYMLMLSASEFSERTFFMFNLLIRKLCGTPPLKLSMCNPLSADSRLLVFCNDSLESRVSKPSVRLHEE